MRSRSALYLVTAIAIAMPALAATVSTTVDLSRLGDGKNSIHYFNSGGILFGFLEGKEFVKFAMETVNGRPVAMTATGEAQLTQQAPAGNPDKHCVEWKQRCWESLQLQVTVCEARCTKRKHPESQEVKEAGPQKDVIINISSAVAPLD
ncbi:MAG TPA: hypothetical protein VEB21_06305 [Terriglobales bacterium]|nr:hypothetical protein [Terriglobales bacterium]